MTFSIISHRKNNKQAGLCISGFATDNIVYFDQTTASFVHLPPVVYKDSYQSRPLMINEYGNWVKFISKHKRKYLEVDFVECHQILNTVLIRLRQQLQNDHLGNHTHKLQQMTMCPICLSEFKIGNQMISFHQDHVKHLACPTCFSDYHLDSCPICRLPIS